ncbi:transglycosylase SLT domain-containing protein [Nocardioides sp. MAH-18]|uniref:Transglycosylase SLT domain-containing protein n=1 Tax=Nocardioides agri TaxID=2682843 RepID=A0A6L6XVC7_9ACTN|nr:MULTISPECIES: transglycosylase SLT domain-containing protein [unclassified Nocardioides]MBA2955777.1 transglycosylase SLT domain-containing protein [Nocardioides sp. CGMCC 1.13656]MVQ50627.1 transglycosylase SLT domain-containing protein [Nocardioides sp. MAH-18]
MSIAEVTSRIAEIRAQLSQLQPAVSAPSAAFAGALQDATSSPATARVSSAQGRSVVDTAKKYLGVPYVWGGTNPATGLDCSGLVQKVYSELGYDLPRVSYQQAQAGRAVGSLAEAQPGDVLAFGSPVHHVGIYIGDNQMIHAPRPGKDVEISSVYEAPTAIRRILPDGAAAGVTGPTGLTGIAASGRVAAGTPYSALFDTAAAKYGVSAGLLSAVAKQESGYDPRATSPAGAQGLMQLMPATARGLGVTDSYDPTQAVDGAARLLKSLMDRFGSTELALAAYNAGPGAVLRYDGIPPYAETQNYVRSVMSTMEAA